MNHHDFSKTANYNRKIMIASSQMKIYITDEKL
jgi:hypothetical protein